MNGRILQLVTSKDRRGAQVFAVDLDAALTARGSTVRTVALVPHAGGDGELPVPAVGSRRSDPRGFWTLRREAGASSVVVAHGSSTLLAGTGATLGTRRPLVYRTIGDPRFWASTAARRLRVGVMLRRARLVVALWPGAATSLQELHGIPPERLRVIPNGVPAERFPAADADGRRRARLALGAEPDVPLVLSMGSLSVEKNVAAAVRAMAAVPDAHLLVVGAGPERAALEGLAADVAPGRVRFLGPTREPAVALAAADVIVLPSLTEGLPGVLIEAAFTGVPAVASDVGGVREIVEPDESGVLVPVGDDERLAAGLRATLAAHDALGAAARARCLARFEIGVVAEAWEDALRDVT